jgi:hypothetical protein
MFLSTPARIANITVSVIVSWDVANNETRNDSDKFELLGSNRLATVTEALRFEKYEQSTHMATSTMCMSERWSIGFAITHAMDNSTAKVNTLVTTIFGPIYLLFGQMTLNQ